MPDNDSLSLRDYLIPPIIEYDDIKQEVELLKLQGHERVNRRFVRQRLLAKQREFLFWDELMDLEGIVNLRVLMSGGSREAVLSPDQYSHIMTWAAEKGDEILDRVGDFLEEPSEEALVELLSFLTATGVIQPVTKHILPERSAPDPLPGHHATSLTSLFLRAFKQQDQEISVDYFYQVARQEHQSKRPEAATRQILRRLTRDGTLLKTDDASGNRYKPGSFKVN